VYSCVHLIRNLNVVWCSFFNHSRTGQVPNTLSPWILNGVVRQPSGADASKVSPLPLVESVSHTGCALR
jgi:hypothetical protein